jgi:hypothetical protein
VQRLTIVVAVFQFYSLWQLGRMNFAKALAGFFNWIKAILLWQIIIQEVVCR